MSWVLYELTKVLVGSEITEKFCTGGGSGKSIPVYVGKVEIPEDDGLLAFSNGHKVVQKA